MLNSLQEFLSGNFMAHGYCYLWKPTLVLLHAGSDLLIALAYYSIPLMLVYFVRRRQDVPFEGIFLLFSAFILSCGTGHLLEIWTLWHPDYWLSGSIKAITAIVSLYTASELLPLIPQALALTSPAQLEAANLALEKEIAEHKQTVKALKQSQQRLSLLVQQTPLAVIEWNLEGEVSDWNPAAEKIFGYEKKDAIARHATKLIMPHCAQEQFNTLWQDLMACEGGSCTSNEYYTPDGRHIFCEWHNIPLIEPNGNVIGVASLVQDITQRQEAEDALRRAYEELEQRVQERTQQLATANEDLQSEIIERQLAQLALAEREHYLAALVEVQHRLLAFKGEEDYYTPILEVLGQAADASHIYVFENSPDLSYQSPTAQRSKWCACGSYCLNNEPVSQPLPYSKCIPYWHERLAQGETIMERVSDFPDKQRFILESQGILSVLVLPLMVQEQFFGLIVFDNCTAAQVWSASAVDLLKAAAAALSLQHERSKAEVALRQSEAQLREQTVQLEQTVFQLKQTQAQLVQTEKMSSLGMMVAGIAHEINNPVSFVYGNLAPAEEYIEDLLELVKLYQQHYPFPVSAIQNHIDTIDLDFVVEDLPHLLESMRVGAERIRDLVLTLRTFSRLDQAEMKRVNIHEGLDSTLLILQHRLKEKPERPGIEVIKKYGNLPPIECYCGQLNQVFMNILANAIDALESKRSSSSSEQEQLNGSVGLGCENWKAHASPRIEISTEVLESVESTSSSPRVVIRIVDNGPGMTQEVRNLIFDPFFTTKPVGQGTGLGLSISYQIVVAGHGGQLECVSAPGQGTVFMIEIPIQQPKRKLSGRIEPTPATNVFEQNMIGRGSLERPAENNPCDRYASNR